MKENKTYSLEQAREQVEVLTKEFGETAEKLASAERELKIAELEQDLANAQTARAGESAQRLGKELEVYRMSLPDPETVKKEGEIVTNIDWKNGANVSIAYIWSHCMNDWTHLTNSSWDAHQSKVWGLICTGVIVIAKGFFGNYKLVRYQYKYFWIE